MFNIGLKFIVSHKAILKHILINPIGLQDRIDSFLNTTRMNELSRRAHYFPNIPLFRKNTSIDNELKMIYNLLKITEIVLL